jgi:hypothetical protein
MMAVGAAIRRLFGPYERISDAYCSIYVRITPIHWLCHAWHRWLTGDRVSYMSGDEMHAQLTKTFGEQAVRATARIAPWRNNLAFMVRL